MTAHQYLLLYDLHYPEHDATALACVLDYAKRNRKRISGVIWGGDQLDLACISHHNANKPKYRQRGALKSNLCGFIEDVLNPLDDILGKDADKRWIMGNHEAWLTEQLSETNPELEGIIDLAEQLGLEERGYTVIQQGGHTKLGKLVAIHGDTVGGGMHSAKKAADVYAGSSVVMGHHHTLQTFTRTSPVSESSRWTATVLPCLCRLNPHYARNKANSWLQGFGIASVRSNGHFNLFAATIVDGTCSMPDGEVYGRKK